MAGQLYRAMARGYGSYKNIKNNVISKYLGDKLEGLYSDPKELETLGIDTKKDTSKDSGYDKNLGQPKQDLNKQSVPEYQPPTSAGKDSNFYKSAEEQDTKEFGNLVNPITTQPNQNSTQQNTQSPVVDNGVNAYQTGLQTKNDAIRKSNEDLLRRYLDVYTTASKFGDIGQQFQKDATNIYQNQLKKGEEAPSYYTKNMQTDADGYAFEMKWNGKQFVKVPVNGADGKPLLMKDVASEKKDKEWEKDYKERTLSHKIDLDNANLEIKQMLADLKASKEGSTGNGNKGNGNGNGNNSSTGETGEQVVVDATTGKEVLLENRDEPVLDKITGEPTGKTTNKWYIKGTNQPAGDLLTGMQNLRSKNKRVVEGQKDKYKQKNMVVEDKGKRKQLKEKVTGDIDKILSKLSPEARDAWILKHGELLNKLK